MILVRRSALVVTVLASSLLSATLYAQSTTRAKPATTVHRRVAPATPALPKNIPPVKALMKTEFALRYQDIKVGTGDEAKPGQIYSVNYTGWLASDGTKFDSSYDRGRPIEFPQGAKRVIIGWDEGFEGMKVGGKRRLFIPYQLAYGPTGRGPIPAKANLIFDIELVGVRDMNAPMPMVPRIVPPPTAPTTPQGTPTTPPPKTAPASPAAPTAPPKPE
jgi:peptidylprolyl isomerase